MKKTFFLFAVLGWLATGCSHVEIDHHPLSKLLNERFRIVEQKMLIHAPANAFVNFVDWDKDGKDEIVHIVNAKKGNSLVTVYSLEYEPLRQVSGPFRYFYSAEFDADTNGVDDLVFTAEDDNSLYITFIPVLLVESPRQYFFATKKSFLKNFGGNVSIAVKENNPPDPTSVILSVLTTFTRAPRHIFSYDFPGRKINFDLPIGGIVENICRGAFTAPERKEILFGTYACANGADASGIHDWESWLVLLSEQGQILYKKPVGEFGSFLHVSPWTFVSKNGEPSVLVVRNHYSKTQSEPDFVGRWCWKERESFPKIHFRQGISAQPPYFWTNPENGKREVLFSLADGSLVEVDEELHILRIRKLDFLQNPKEAQVLFAADLVGGMKPEFILVENGRFYILDRDFHLLASYEAKGAPHLVHVSPDQKPKLAILHDKSYYLAAVQRNPVYYGFRAGLGLLGLLLIFGGVMLAEHRKRKRHEVLFLQQNVFRAWVLENLDTGVLIFDSSGKLHSVNRKARQLLGAAGDLPDGHQFDEAQIHPELRQAILSILRRLEEDCSRAMEESVRLESGEETRRLLLSGECIHDENNRILGKAISIRDVTETLRSHEMLAWAKIARQLAHEVKTPLASMLLAAEKLRKMAGQLLDSETRAKFEEYLQFVFDEIQHLRRLSESMMQLTDLEAKPFQPVDLNRLLRESLERVRPLIPKNTQIHLELDEKLPEVSGNPQQLGLALNNLLKNAAEAVADGDSIHIRTSLAYGLQDDSQSDQPFAVIEISDSGKGMAPHVQERIFEPYFSNRERGTGLGLAIVKKIVTDHGGRITFESQEGVGTTFWIYLPANRARGAEQTNR